ncbi:MAG: type II secretion system F family protein [bacterium]|nr:type II secretion system F family protein [bacterium]
MSNFKYKARDAEGKLVEGILEAENEQNLAAKLAEINIVLVEAKSVKAGAGKAFYFGKVKRREILLFTNHMATSIEAGVPVVTAISDYSDETENPRVKSILEDVQRQVLAGTNLSEAMSKHPEAFSELYVSIVATGEATGNLDIVLLDLVAFLEWQEDLAGQIKKSSIYPGFLVGMIITVIVLMMTVTLPKFIPVLKGFNVPLPRPTRMLISTSEFFQAYWLFMIAGLVLFIITYKLTKKTLKGKYFWDNVTLKLPIVGKLMQKIILSKFAHYFSILYSAGIGIIESFIIIERVVGNEVVRGAVKRSREAIRQGSTIYDSL